MPPVREPDLEADVIALSFATRLLLSELDREVMVERALEGLADFSRSGAVALFSIDDEGKKAMAEGLISSQGYSRPEKEYALEGTPCAEVIQSKRPGLYPLASRQELPWPASKDGEPGRVCLCAPLVAADNKVTGLATFTQPEGVELGQVLNQPLMLFLTVAAIGLETAKLFQMAVQDGLTGLYVRRYFDLRLSEEEARVTRYGGEVALLLFDLDHFKKVNDDYGHQTGDAVLKKAAEVIRGSVRQDVDVACRYGGEEFAVILPSTNLAGALVVAERVRERCLQAEFPGPKGPIKVTMSGGVAYMEGETPLSAHELIKRADEALYQAKENGRNQIRIWTA